MKSKKKLLLSVSLIVICLFVAASSVNAEMSISYVDYPEEVEVGETITVTVHFEYTDTHQTFLKGAYIYLFYSINSLSVDEEDLFVSVSVATGSRPTSRSFVIPVSEIEKGDTLRFRIWVDYMIQNVAAHTIFTDTYQINVALSTETNGAGISIIGLSSALITLALIVTRKKKISLKR